MGLPMLAGRPKAHGASAFAKAPRPQPTASNGCNGGATAAATANRRQSRRGSRAVSAQSALSRTLRLNRPVDVKSGAGSGPQG